jgi:hypothetical protein
MTGTNALNVVLVHGGFVDDSGWEGVPGSSGRTATMSPSSSTDNVACRRRGGHQARLALDGPAPSSAIPTAAL